MIHTSRFLVLAAALSVALLACATDGDAFQPDDDDDAPPADFSVEARGPVHEAFAQPNEPIIAMGEPIGKQPPPPLPEQPPEQRPNDPNAEWIPGYWAWDADRNDFVWVTGTFRNAPPGRRWVPGHWANSQEGWRWVPGFWAPENQGELQYTPEPPAPLEAGPVIPAPDADSTYVPGYWNYDGADQRFAWRPGYWAPYRAGRLWVSPQYYWTPNGYLFTNGYWDYPLDDRGLLFAPAYFPQPLWVTPGWVYRPRFVVSIGLFFNSGFYRPGCNSFFFGNYYGNTYAGLGYRPWWGAGRNSAYDYHRWQNRGNPQWAAQHQQLYADRQNGRAPLPPTNLAQQRAQFQGKNGGPNAAGVTSLRKFTPPGGGALVPNNAVAAQNLQADRYRDIAKLRGQTEGPAARKSGPNGPGANPPNAPQASLKLPPAPPRVRPVGMGNPAAANNLTGPSNQPVRPGNGGEPNLPKSPFAGNPGKQPPNPGSGPGSGPAANGNPNPLPKNFGGQTPGNPFAQPNAGPGPGPAANGNPNPLPKNFGGQTPGNPLGQPKVANPLGQGQVPNTIPKGPAPLPQVASPANPTLPPSVRQGPNIGIPQVPPRVVPGSPPNLGGPQGPRNLGAPTQVPNNLPRLNPPNIPQQAPAAIPNNPPRFNPPAAPTPQPAPRAIAPPQPSPQPRPQPGPVAAPPRPAVAPQIVNSPPRPAPQATPPPRPAPQAAPPPRPAPQAAPRPSFAPSPPRAAPPAARPSGPGPGVPRGGGKKG